MSPQARRGRHAPASHRRTARREALAEQRSSQAEPEKTAEVTEPRPTRRPSVSSPKGPGFFGRLRRNWFLRALYSYTKAYIPIFGLVAALLVLLWGVQTFGPKSTKLDYKGQWLKIERKYSPVRDAASQKVLDSSLDFSAQIAGYSAFRDATKGWLDEVKAVSDWGPGSSDVKNLLRDGQKELDLLDQVVNSSTPDALVQIASGKLEPADQAFKTDVALVRTSLGLSAAEPQSTAAEASGTATSEPTPSPSPVPTATPSLSPSPSPAPSATK